MAFVRESLLSRRRRVTLLVVFALAILEFRFELYGRAQEDSAGPVKPDFEISFRRDTAYLDNEAMAISDEVQLRLLQDRNAVLVLSGCASVSERNANQLSQLRPAYI